MHPYHNKLICFSSWAHKFEGVFYWSEDPIYPHNGVVRVTKIFYGISPPGKYIMNKNTPPSKHFRLGAWVITTHNRLCEPYPEIIWAKNVPEGYLP